MYSQWQMHGIFETRDQVSREFEEASKNIEKAQEMEKQKEKMVAKAEITTTLMERVRRSVLLGELTRQRPQGVNFVSMELKTKELSGGARPNTDVERAARAAQGLPVEAPKPPPVDVTVNLIGTAPSDAEVSAYMANLQKSSLLVGVTLLYSEEYRKTKEDAAVRRFSLDMRINPSADTNQGGTVVDAGIKN
jgi:Tfp pilus assembly protein PilN